MMKKNITLRLSLMVLAAFLTLTLAGAARGPALDENTVENISKKIFPSVVKVETRNGMTRVATGVIIDKEGSIVTTALVSPRDEKIIVTTTDGKRTEAKFLGLDPETSLALIQIKEKNLEPITLAKTSGLSPGSWVGVISISPENTPAVTQGIVSSIAPDKLRLNVWVTRGASGSPVVNRDGQMVGLLRGIYTEDHPVVFEFREKEIVGSGYVFSRAEAPSSGMALAVPVDIVAMVSAEIKEKGKVSRGWMGVSISENDRGQVEINDVESDSPAELAGLKKGDILLKIDGRPITSASMFVSEIRTSKPGLNIKLEVERSGKATDVKVKLGEYPEKEARRELELRYPRLFPARPSEPLKVEPEKAPELRLREIWPRWEKRKYIGVYLEAINKELLEYFGVKEGSGLLVTRLTKDGPAEKAGLKVGDVIIRVNGKRVDSVDELSELIQDRKRGDRVKIEVIRNKKPMDIEVEVEEEERQGLGWSFSVSPEAWGDFSEELARQFEKSRQVYEKTAQQSLEKMKKLKEEMLEQSEKLKQEKEKIYEKSKEEAQKLIKGLLTGDRVVFRV
ncbi:MAG: PDZ domain-containing protein [Clostridiales bacterium]|nr:PDZ domain-containing protein [Clostridiales bacterium]